MGGRETSKTVTHLAAAAGLCLGLLMGGPASAAQSLNPFTATVAPASAQSPAAVPAGLANFSGEPASNDARHMADWVVNTRDNRNLPFVIVDKKETKVFVFDAGGRLLGATQSLLGLARGDDSAPGIGDRKLSDIPPDERTTPAGRFVAALGQDLARREVLWVDYQAALALHRVLDANTKEARLQRLASASASDRRISFGCINVPGKFYDDVVHPAFAGTNGIVYILPEIKSIPEVFHISAM